MISIAVEEIVQLVHLEGLVLESDLKLSDPLVMCFNFRVESEFLLVKDRLFGQKVIIISSNPTFSLLLLDQFNLILNPLFLHLRNFLINLLDLFCDTITLIF